MRFRKSTSFEIAFSFRIPFETRREPRSFFELTLHVLHLLLVATVILNVAVQLAALLCSELFKHVKVQGSILREAVQKRFRLLPPNYTVTWYSNTVF
jgi:hypothetical protein